MPDNIAILPHGVIKAGRINEYHTPIWNCWVKIVEGTNVLSA